MSNKPRSWSRSCCSWFWMYALIITSSSPTVLTQYPRDQNARPYKFPFTFPRSRLIRIALFPFKKTTVLTTLYFGGTLNGRSTWSAMHCLSPIRSLFCDKDHGEFFRSRREDFHRTYASRISERLLRDICSPTSRGTDYASLLFEILLCPSGPFSGGSFCAPETAEPSVHAPAELVLFEFE